MKQTVDGENHVVAGRDIIINAQYLSTKFNEIYDNLLKPAFESLDKRITDLFPGGLFSPTSAEIKHEFSSEKLFTSLTLLGLPINVALHAISRTEFEFSKLSQTQQKITTDDIRIAVAKSLYQYDSSEFCEKKRQFWGDKYVRIYGRPNQKLLVLTKDGNSHELNYRYVLTVIIPQLIDYIWGIGKFEHLRKAISIEDKNEMADEILRAVKSLGVYRIHFSSLLKIAKELALQPPHPWLVECAFDYEAIAYDYDKAKMHCVNMVRDYGRENFESCLYSFRETVHHSCSAVLAYYGIYMGCGYLAPLHTLHRVITSLEKGMPIEATCLDRIDIKSDLRSLGVSITEISRCIKLLREQVSVSGSSEKEEIKEAIDLAECMFGLCDNIISYYFEITNLQNSDLSSVNSHESLAEAIKAAFHIIPGFELSEDKKGRLWLIHNHATPLFRDIRNRILLAPIFTHDHHVTPSSLFEFGKNISNKNISNCIIFVSNSEFSSSCFDYRDSLNNNGIISFFTTIENLIESALSEDSLGVLEIELANCM